MTLSDYMKTADPDQQYQVGAMSGFFWFGKPENFEKEIPAVEYEMYDRHIRYITNSSYAKKTGMRKKSLEEFNFGDREVEKEYKVRNGNIALIVPGDEWGPFWDQEEWDDRFRGYEERTPIRGEDKAVDELRTAIVKNALDDYYNILVGDYTKETGIRIPGATLDTVGVNRLELKNFFHGRWFETLMPDTDGPRLFSQFEKYAKEQIPEQPRIRYETKDITVVQAYNRNVYIIENGKKVWEGHCKDTLLVKDLVPVRRKWLRKEEIVL